MVQFTMRKTHERVQTFPRAEKYFHDTVDAESRG